MDLPLRGYGLLTVFGGFVFVLWRWLKRLKIDGYRQPTIDELKMLFGFLLLLIVAFLCASIALGNVREESSFGLTQMITVLSALGGGFATWAFSSSGLVNRRPSDKDWAEFQEWLRTKKEAEDKAA